MGDTYKIKVIKADTGEVVKTLEAATERSAERAERAEFEARFKHLDLTQEPDAWGVPRYKHGAISLAWEAWQAARRAPAVPQGLDAAVRDVNSRRVTELEARLGRWGGSRCRLNCLSASRNRLGRS